jgi:hypothetical protein
MTKASAQKEALLRVKDIIFHCQLKEVTPKIFCTYHKPMVNMKYVVQCWKPDKNYIDQDDLRGIQIKENEGEHIVEGNVLDMVASYRDQLIKTKKHNIGTKEAPNLSIIGDYWTRRP